MQTLLRSDIETMVTNAMDNLIYEIQQRLGVTSGDVAAQFFSGPALVNDTRLDDLNKQIADLMVAYVEAEKMYQSD